MTSPLEDWTDEATIAWKKTYFANVKKRKKTKVNHFACCTGQGLSIRINFPHRKTFAKLIPCTEDFLVQSSEIEVAPKKTPPPSYSETYSNYCLHEKV